MQDLHSGNRISIGNPGDYVTGARILRVVLRCDDNRDGRMRTPS